MPVKKIYLETTIFNQAHRNGISGLRIKELLADNLLTPAVGIHIIYEMARIFCNKDGIETGAKLFTILRDLDPYYQPPPEILHDQEILKLKKGTAVLPFLDPINLSITKQEVERLARGICDEKARNFIVNREAALRDKHPKFASDYINILAFNEEHVFKNSFRTFEDIYLELEDQMPELIYNFLNEKMQKVTLPEAHELYIGKDFFPAIRSTLRSHVYLCYICIKHKSVPRKDKIDDYRHIIEASYCDIFVTNDTQLSRTVSRINPDLEVLKGSDLIK